MQTKTKARASQPVGKHILSGTVPFGNFTRRKLSKADKTAGGKPASNFLNTVFSPIPAFRFNRLFNRDNYDFLYESARNYSTLLGSSFDFSIQENDFTGLFQYFEELLPGEQQLLLIEKNKKLSFQIRFGCDFLIGEVFFIPIEILNKTEGVFRDILLLFFQFFHQRHCFFKKENFYDYELIVDCYIENWLEEEQEPEILDFLKAYKEGYIHDTFSLIYQKPKRSIGELEKLIEKYIPQNDREENLLATVRQGVTIMNMGKNIFSYACRPKKNDGHFYDVEEDCVIEAERMLRLVYSNSDYVTDNYLEYINTESDNLPNEYFPRQSVDLSPNTNRLLEVDFVECFFTWLMEFIQALKSLKSLKSLKPLKPLRTLKTKLKKNDTERYT